ncbi:dTDP-4-dehydrorhamnose reductase [Murimonas intestini]|uniref:dTDP-4-dehydrorhamnose reductase n=1 Tax=Murimonas intestini TaxID=1337051 RepID=UPI0011DDBA27|nr:dTDP-4-dehydrorhamnose reductase [Murimonas intestini]
MKILVTGCNGQLGRAVNEQYAGNENVELINTDVDQLDITNVDDVLKMVRDVKPDVILNCAAHTNVNLCESQQDLAYRINAIGPRNLSIAAADVDAKMVQVSTDYVFAGDGNRPYTEFDPTDPQSMYGATKLAGEQFVQQFAKRYFIIRTAWLYGDGKNFVKTMLQLSENNDKVRVVGDQLGTPTSAAELARMIKYLIPTDNYGIFHGTCEGVCSWADFTKEIFRLAGKKTEVEYITTDEFPTPAKRPAYSVLENYMLKLTTDYSFAQWEDAIAEYMKWLLG